MPPMSLSRALSAGLASPALISLLSNSTMSFGVCLGAGDAEPNARVVAWEKFANAREIRKHRRASRSRDRPRS